MRSVVRILTVVAGLALVLVPVAPTRAGVLDAPVFTDVVGFATKTGFRGVIAWEADQPVAGRVRYGTSPGALNLTAPFVPLTPDTAQMVVLNFIGGVGPQPGDTVYFRVEDQLTGAQSAIQSFAAENAYNDWNGSIYTIDLLVQLDSEATPSPDVPGDVALEEIAAGVNVWAERLYDGLDGKARIGNVLVTDTNVDYAANVPGAPVSVQVLEACPSNQGNMADVLVQTTVPLDSHTFGGFAVDDFCTQFYIGRVGWLGSHWLDDLSLGYVMTHEGMHYLFNTPDLYDGPDCRNLAWDGSIMHNTGGYTGSRWELSELDRNPNLTPCDHGGEPWSWDALRERYTNVPLNPNGPIDHMVDPDAKGNADGGALNIMVLDREPGGSTLTSFTPDDAFVALPAGSQRKSYVGGTGDAVAACGGWMNPGIGGACFDLAGGEPGATITIEDTAGWDVGGSFQFEDAAGNLLSSGFVCGGTSEPVPAGATRLWVFVHEALAPAACLLSGGAPPGSATAGTITVAIEPVPPPNPAIQTKAYVGGPGDLVANCGNPGIGGTCFNLAAPAASAAITIDDAAPYDVGALWQAEDAAGNVLDSDFMCGSTAIPVPAATTRVWVFIGEALGPAECLFSGVLSPGAGTTGTITVAFS